jgi:hypothetical protein
MMAPLASDRGQRLPRNSVWSMLIGAMMTAIGRSMTLVASSRRRDRSPAHVGLVLREQANAAAVSISKIVIGSPG